jgi:hypothetical protein
MSVRSIALGSIVVCGLGVGMGACEPAAPCTVTENADGSASISCPDGSSATVAPGTNGVDGTNGSNGSTGADGNDGTNGTDGTNGSDGVDGADGVDGTDGLTCLIQTDFFGDRSKECSDGSSEHVFIGELTPVDLGLASDGSRNTIVADFTGDGIDDAFQSLGAFNSANGVQTDRLLVGGGDLRFTPAIGTGLTDDSFTIFATAADFDGDGALDVFVSKQARPSRVYDNNGGLFTDTGVSYRRAYSGGDTGDIDGDGDVDLVGCAGVEDGVFVLRNVGGALVEEAAPVFAVNCTPVALADLDGDGDLDVIVGSEDLHVLINDGTGAFTAVAVDAAQTRLFSVSAADIDGDGRLDIVAGQANLNGVLPTEGLAVWRNTSTAGSLSFAGVAQPGVASFNGLEHDTGDLDGDGDLDLVLRASTTATVYFNDGTGLFEEVAAFPTAGMNGILVQDIDGDTDPDLWVSVDGVDAVFLNH